MAIGTLWQIKLTPLTLSRVQDEDEELYWQFIQGMLANHASLPLDRIYALLSMFVEGGLTLTEPALQKFLAAKVDTRLLVMTQGEYALPNDD